MSAQTPDIVNLAYRALAACGGNRAAAEQWLCRQAQKDSEAAALLIRAGASAAMCRTYTSQRQEAIRSAANPDRAMRDDGLAAVNRVSLVGLLAWPLPGTGKPLGEATRGELGESLRYCRRLSQTFDTNARFLNNVWQLAKDERQPVRRQLTPEQVRSCRERAEKAVA